MSTKDEQLPEGAEKLLAEWPLPERSDDDWEKSAVAIEARMAEAAEDDASDDDALLAAPLPAEPGEEGATPEPAPMSLAELARQSVADDDEDPDVDLARDALSVATRARTSQPVIPTSVRADAARLAVQAATPAAQTATEGPAVSAAPAPTPKPSRAPWIASALVLGGLVIAVGIVWKLRTPVDAIAYMPNKAEAPAQPAPVKAEAPKAGDPESLSIDQLPGEGDKPAGPAAGGKVARAGAGAGKAAAAPPPEKKGEAPEEPEPSVVAKPKPKPDPDEDLKPAANPTDVPQKPSTGAVQAAIGSVLGSARACVAGHKQPSRATLTFSSDGRVRSVAISGPAAGSGAEGCIRSALSRARVQPFSRPTFSVGVTVRP